MAFYFLSVGLLGWLFVCVFGLLAAEVGRWWLS